jgi:hypothetical protein
MVALCCCIWWSYGRRGLVLVVTLIGKTLLVGLLFDCVVCALFECLPPHVPIPYNPTRQQDVEKEKLSFPSQTGLATIPENHSPTSICVGYAMKREEDGSRHDGGV